MFQSLDEREKKLVKQLGYLQTRSVNKHTWKVRENVIDSPLRDSHR